MLFFIGLVQEVEVVLGGSHLFLFVISLLGDRLLIELTLVQCLSFEHFEPAFFMILLKVLLKYFPFKLFNFVMLFVSLMLQPML